MGDEVWRKKTHFYVLKFPSYGTKLRPESAHDEAYIGSPIDRLSNPDYITVNLVTTPGGTTPYLTQYSYTASPQYVPPGPQAVGHVPNFNPANGGKGAGLGVLESGGIACDHSDVLKTSGGNPCFAYADTALVQKPFNDGLVEFIYPVDGAGALPFLNYSAMSNYDPAGRLAFSDLWFKHYNDGTPPAPGANNYFHLVGAFVNIDAGQTNQAHNCSIIGVANMDDPLGTTPVAKDARAAIEETVSHEFAHGFNVNACSVGGHESPQRDSWCQSFAQCAVTTPQLCPMNNLLPSAPQNHDGWIWFCKEDLLLGDPLCPTAPGFLKPGAIRTDKDPE